MGFADVAGQVIQFPRCVFARLDRLPITLADRGLVAQFPIQEFVAALRMAGRFRSEQFRHNGNSVEVAGDRNASQFGNRWHYIGEIPQVVAHPARCDLAGPADQHRNPQASFVQLTFAAAKLDARFRMHVGTMKASRVLLAGEVICAAVVATEKNDRVLFQVVLSQQGEYLADLSVDHRYHGRITLRLLGPGFVFVNLPSRIVVGDVKDAVRRRDRHVTEKRLLGVLANKGFGLIDDHVMRIGFAVAAPMVAGQRDLFAVAKNVGRIIRVSMHLVVVAIKQVKTMPFRHAGRPASPTAPLAEPAGGIASRFQDRGDGCFVRTQRSASTVGPYRSMPAVFAGHQATTRRGTHRGTGHRLREPHTFTSHSIQVRCLDIRIPHARKFVIPQLISHDVDDVWRRGIGG